MRNSRRCAALAAVIAAALLAPPPTGEAYGTIGAGQSLAGRHVRVHDNFTDATANDNVTVHPSFPGWTGAELAIWKAAVEWASERHGDGQGDPHQAGTLGSGGANFDPSFQGVAASIGGSSNNVHAAISGSDGGVLAYCEGSGSDTWRIRYYEGWTWDDGPGTSISGVDLQGVACHEYGHALGLGHSDVGGATMQPSIIGNGVQNRSIHADDIAGVQAVYGVKSPSKPRITALSVAGGTATISGANFSAAGNEVWFTRKLPAVAGAPVKVVGVASSGSSIQVAIPYTAGPGDVLVKNAGSGHASLSNPFPIATGDTSANDQPSLVSVTPATIPAVAQDGQTITVVGNNLDELQSVSLDGVPLTTFPVLQWQMLDPSTFEVYVPLVDQLGSVDLVATTPHGSASVPISVTACDPPVVDLRDSLPFSGILGFHGIEIDVGGEPGELFFLTLSTDPAPSSLPGFVELAHGGGFAALVVLKTGLIDPAKGWFHYATPVPPQLGTFIYVQAAVMSLASPAFPLQVSNLQEGIVVF